MYSIDCEFIDHVIDKYIFQQNTLLNCLIRYEQIEYIILIKLKNPNKISDDNIEYIIKYIDPLKITALCAYKNEKITGTSIKYFPNLTYLNAHSNKKITDESVKLLTNLTFLSASHNEKITDESIKLLTNLNFLCVSHNKKITTESILHLTNLKRLITLV